MACEILLCVATELECGVLREKINTAHGRIRILRMGVGPVNAAHAVTLALTRDQPKSLVVCGVGGAYPGSGLRIGDVACAEIECYGDLGAASPQGFLDMETIGFPIIDSPVPIYNDLPMSVFP